MTKIGLPPAFAFASNTGPGALNVGTPRFASRLAFAPEVSVPPARATSPTAAAATSTAERTASRFFMCAPSGRRVGFVQVLERASRIAAHVSVVDVRSHGTGVAFARVAVAAPTRPDQAEPVALRRLAVRELGRQLPLVPEAAVQ